jgi:CubicO group peptidase (beta-lactamase class C family)
MFSLAASALEYARKHALHALVVAQGDEIIAQTYDHGYEPTKPHALYSGTKSFWGITALTAQRDSMLALDELVADTFQSWKADRWKRRVTLRQLLQLTAGFSFGGLGASVPTYEKALAADLRHQPGATFTYGGIALQVFGAVMARKLESRKQTPHEYLQQRVLDPIGMHLNQWRTLADGTHPLPTGAFATAQQWLKFGQFMCERHEEFSECFVGSPANPRYGLGFWLGVAGVDNLAYASGAGGQGLYIVPARKLVVVHFANARSFRHETFLKRLLSSFN